MTPRLNFTGTGYTLGGNDVVLANDIDGDNTSGTNTVDLNVTLSAAQSLTQMAARGA